MGIEFAFVSHIKIFTKKSLLLVVINILDLNNFKYAEGTNPREFWAAHALI